jgi:hypothetical protein
MLYFSQNAPKTKSARRIESASHCESLILLAGPSGCKSDCWSPSRENSRENAICCW